MKFLKILTGTAVFCVYLLTSLEVQAGYTKPKEIPSSVEAPHVKVELVSNRESLSDGADFDLGVLFVPEAGWHIYWENPGDSGLPPKVEFMLPEGMQLGDRWHFPPPEKIRVGELVNFGYSTETLLWGKAKLLPSFSHNEAGNAEIPITAKVKWLVCQEECVPGEAELKLKFPWVDSVQFRNSSESEKATVFAQARVKENLIERTGKVPSYQVSLKDTGKGQGILELEILKNKQFRSVTESEIFFFPKTNIGVAAHDPQKVKIQKDRVKILLEQAELKQVGAFDGLLQVKDRFFEIEVVLNESLVKAEPPQKLLTIETASLASLLIPPAPVVTVTPVAEMPEKSMVMEDVGLSLWGLLLFAFLGGLLLNLMPCILPVLSLKVLSLAQVSEDAAKDHKKQAIAHVLGTLVSFWVLGIIFILLKSGGEKIGWGFQLQSPIFVTLLGLLFFWMGLNLFGVFEVGARWMGLGTQLTQRQGIQGAFFTGVFSVVAATPCSAPFMGTALGVGFTQSFPVMMAVLTWMGIGLVMPYFLLSWFPAFQRILPKPGNWMITLKQFMAFPLFATVIWLSSVIVRQSGAEGGLGFWSLMLVSYALFWLVKTQVVTNGGRGLKLVGLVICVWFLSLSYGQIRSLPSFEKNADKSFSYHLPGFKPFDVQKIEEARKEGKTVFIDFTAEWCITCKLNEKMVLKQDDVQEALKQEHVAAFVADWTMADPEITAFMAKFGRNSVPLYVIFPAASDQPVILPQILKKSDVLETLTKVAD